jgi:hypothetical protein
MQRNKSEQPWRDEFSMKSFMLFAMLCLMPVLATAASISGTLTGGGGIDDMSLTVQDAQGHSVQAYCLSVCGDWFTDADKDGVVYLKQAYKQRKVLLEYTTEPNRDRVAGAGDDDIEIVKKVSFL